MPLRASSDLSTNVPDGLKQDVEEAETDHFYGQYKSSVIMCRRALQLAIEDRLPAKVFRSRRWTLGPLLDEAQKQTKPLLTDQSYALGLGIKEYGDTGAHRRETVTAEQAQIMATVAVQLLNELFP